MNTPKSPSARSSRVQRMDLFKMYFSRLNPRRAKQTQVARGLWKHRRLFSALSF